MYCCFSIEKNGAKTTVDVVKANDSLSEDEYNRLMNGEIIVERGGLHEGMFRIYNKDDIRKILPTFQPILKPESERTE